MAVKVNVYNGGTAAANQLWVANQSAFVSVASIDSGDPQYVQAGVTTVFSSDALFQNTAASLWSPMQAAHYVVNT